MTGRRQRRAHHGTLHELQVAGSGVALDGEVLFEVTYLEFQVGNAGVTYNGVLEFYQAVGQVHVKFAIPVFVHLAFHGKTGAADAYAVTDFVGKGGCAGEHGGIGLDTDVEPEFVGGIGRCQHQDTVLGLYVQAITLHGHTILVDLLCIRCRQGEQRQGNEGNKLAHSVKNNG